MDAKRTATELALLGFATIGVTNQPQDSKLIMLLLWVIFAYGAITYKLPQQILSEKRTKLLQMRCRNACRKRLEE